MSCPFCHLHSHSTFSFRDGFGTSAQIADRIRELGHTHAAVTDHGNVFAHISWQKEMRRREIVSILGCEFYIVESLAASTGKGSFQESLDANCFPHITILAQNQRGYENLLALSTLSWENLYRYPRIDWPSLVKHQEGLVVLSGCIGGWPTRLHQAKGPEAAWEFVGRYRAQIEQWYMELNPAPGVDISENSLADMVRIAADLKLPCVLTADAHFPRPEDHPYQDILFATAMGDKVTNPNRKLKIPAYNYYCSRAELLARAQATAPEIPIEHWEQALDNTGRIAATCHVEIPKADAVKFYGVAPGQSAEYLLEEAVKDAFRQYRDLGRFPEERAGEYNRRAHYELQTLCEKGFADYILAICDVIRTMKARGRVIVTRGSAGGCLLLWLLGASETDPLRFGLSFERFYDATRPDPPDVDVDFPQAFRDEALEYVRERYGAECCSNIAALSQLKAKSAVQDVAMAYGIPREQFGPLTAALSAADDSVDRQIGTLSDPKALAVLEKYPQLRMAEKLVGQYRQSSIHAAGVLVSPTPLSQVVGLVRGKAAQVVASIDKRGAAELGFLKFDFLSVKSLDVLQEVLGLLDRTPAWLSDLPLDDPGALGVAAAGALAGIFQLDGASAARVAREIGLDHFDDLVAASALCRPGPGEWVPTYAANKRDRAAFEAYLAAMDPRIAEIVRPTFGILLYQEQVMQMAREVAGLEWKEVHRLRKEVGLKLGESSDREVAERWEREWQELLVGGFVKNGVPREQAEFWWSSIKAHGGYSFNKSHCLTYALVGYWMCYLKHHHPAEFYEGYCRLETDAVTLKKLIREFRTLGGKIELLSPQQSREAFTAPAPQVLTGGFVNLHGIGPVTAKKVMEKGPFTSWGEMIRALPLKVRRHLEATGAPAVAAGLGTWNPQELILLAPWFPVPCLGPEEAAAREQFELPKLEELPKGEMVDGDVAVCGYVTATKFEQHKVMFTVEDETETILCRVSARNLKELGPRFKEISVGDFVVVTGWWTGDALYVKERVIARPRPRAEPDADPGSRKRPPVPDKVIHDEIAEEIYGG